MSPHPNQLNLRTGSMKKTHSFRHLNLRRLILAMATISVLITIANSVHVTYQLQREQLINNTLEANRVYAAKLAETTSNLMWLAQNQLKHSAERLTGAMDKEQLLLAEAERLYQQSGIFNAIVVMSADAVVAATSPGTQHLIGRKISLPVVNEIIEAKKPMVSKPFMSPSGNYVIGVSHPVYSSDGHYLGYLSGAIYLERDNILHTLLGSHYYQDGSYFYVVDRDSVLIYHNDPTRIGEKVTGNPVIEAVLRNEKGTTNVINSRGIDMLAGFSPVSRIGWGVIAQRPKSATLEDLNDQVQVSFIKTLPLTMLTLLFIWVSSLLISRPLKQLASNTQNLDQPQTQERILSIRSWYLEAALLKAAIIKGTGLLNEKISQLKVDSNTDVMTGLYNRRGMQKVLDYYQEAQQSFAIIALDIDHFKLINDSYGHDVGDITIKNLAEIMRKNAREVDELCRSGGEEFLILLPDTTLAVAMQVAERLRRQVAQYEMKDVGHITISLGVAHCPSGSADLNVALKQADTALYQAKRQGRNQVSTVS